MRRRVHQWVTWGGLVVLAGCSSDGALSRVGEDASAEAQRSVTDGGSATDGEEPSDAAVETQPAASNPGGQEEAAPDAGAFEPDGQVDAGSKAPGSMSVDASVDMDDGPQVNAADAGEAPTATVPPLPVAEPPDDGEEWIPYAQSGSRLLALGYRSESDAMPVFWTLRDTRHGFDCSFMRDDADAIHCVPSKATEVLYLDDECIEPLAPNPTPRRPDGAQRVTLEVGDWVSAVSESGEPLEPTEPGHLPWHGAVYTVGEIALDPAQLSQAERPAGYYEWDRSSDECVPREWFRNDIPVMHRLESVSEAELVRGEVQVLALEHGAYLERIETSDGARISAGLWRGDRRCVMAGPEQCVPLPLVQPSFWNESCEQRLFELGQPPEVDIVYGVEGTNVFEATLLGTADELALYNYVEECVAVDSSSWGERWMFEAGRSAAEALPTLERTTLSHGRLRPQWWVGTIANSQTRVLVQFLPAYEAIALSIETDDGSVCRVRHVGEPDSLGVVEEARCDGDVSVPLTVVEL